jgi:hypothetical protein
MNQLVGTLNSTPLPLLPQNLGVALPPDELCLVAPNYQFESKK